MEIAVSFNWRIDELVQYRKSRLPGGIFVPLAVALLLASLPLTWPTTLVGAATNLLLAYTLVAAFRLLDDLADLPRDRREYPQRVLSRAVSTVHFHIVTVTFLIINAVIIGLTRPRTSLALYIALVVALTVWYCIPGRMVCRGVPNYHVVLLKYPAFVYLLASDTPAMRAVLLISIMVSVYLCVCIYEIAHDRRYYARQSI